MRPPHWALVAVFGAALSPSPTPGQEPAARLEIGDYVCAFRSDGSFEVTDAGGPLISRCALRVFGPEWRSASQTEATDVEAAVTDQGELTFRGRIVEPVSSQPWEYAQRAVPQADGVELSYTLRPLAEMEVNEVSLILDLPIERYAGQRLLFHPRQEAVYPQKPPADYHFAASHCLSLVLAAGETPQPTLAFAAGAFCNVQDTRQWQGSAYQAFAKIVRSRAKVGPGQEFKLSFVLRPHDPRSYEVPKIALTSAEKLAIRGVAPSGERVPCYDRWELTVDLAATYDTPFDPDQVALDALIATPSGRQLRVPGFFYQPYERRLLDATEWLTPTGDAVWKVRFAPVEPGRHSARLVARDRSGEIQSDPIAFQATPSDHRGHVRVSRRDPQCFEFDNGTPYFPIGLNVCWYRSGQGTYDYDDWFERLAAGGGNHARLWMPQWAFGIEWGRPYEYRLDRAWQLDHVMELAERLDITIKLCLENWRVFERDKPPYWKQLGGPCETEREFFTDPEARRMFRNRLRYCVARWGYSPSLMAWELWNEINCVKGYNDYSDVVVEWSADMCRYLKETDPWQHLTVNSLGSCDFNERLWARPEIEWAQMHGYYYFNDTMKQQAVDMAFFIPEWQRKVRAFGKPALFAEFGLTRSKPDVRDMCDRDTEGVHLHNGIWSAMADGGAGTAMLWWWDSYVAPQDLFGVYAPLARFVQDVPWTTAGFRDAQVTVAPDGVRAYGRQSDQLTLLWLQNRRHTWWNVVHDEQIAPVERVTVTLAGVPEGAFAVETWDTWRGEIVDRATHTARDGELSFEFGPLEKDVALKVRRQ